MGHVPHLTPVPSNVPFHSLSGFAKSLTGTDVTNWTTRVLPPSINFLSSDTLLQYKVQVGLRKKTSKASKWGSQNLVNDQSRRRISQKGASPSVDPAYANPSRSDIRQQLMFPISELRLTKSRVLLRDCHGHLYARRWFSEPLFHRPEAPSWCRSSAVDLMSWGHGQPSRAQVKAMNQVPCYLSPAPLRSTSSALLLDQGHSRPIKPSFGADQAYSLSSGNLKATSFVEPET
jgi:hypothetical protein